MLFQEISQLAHIAGITAVISTSISFFLAAIIFSKAIRERSRIILEFGLCVIFTSSPWFPSGFGYLYLIITGVPLPYVSYILTGNLFLPLAIIFWLDIYLTTVKPDRRELGLIIYIIFSTIFLIYLIFYLFLASGAPVQGMIGIIDDPTDPFDIDYKMFVLAYLSVTILLSCATGIHFAIKSIKINEKEIQWKGRFLFIGFIFFGIAATADAIIPMTVIMLIIIRIILVSASIFFYLGFILPKWVKKILFRGIEDQIEKD